MLVIIFLPEGVLGYLNVKLKQFGNTSLSWRKVDATGRGDQEIFRWLHGG